MVILKDILHEAVGCDTRQLEMKYVLLVTRILHIFVHVCHLRGQDELNSAFMFFTVDSLVLTLRKKYRKVFVAHITVLFKLIIYNHIIYSHYTPFPMYRVGLRTPRALMLHLFQGPPQNYATFSGHLGNLPIYNQDEMLHPNHPSLKKSVYG